MNEFGWTLNKVGHLLSANLLVAYLEEQLAQGVSLLISAAGQARPMHVVHHAEDVLYTFLYFC